jgi:hypothetical protein
LDDSLPGPLVVWPPPTPPPRARAIGSYAGVLLRLAALVVDAGVLVLLWVAMAIGTFLVWGLDPTDDARLAAQVAILIAPAAYFIIGWCSGGTAGMRLLHLRIGRATDGATITARTAMIRCVATFGWSLGLTSASMLLAPDGTPLRSLIGWLVAAWVLSLLWTTRFSPSRQGWHDRVAGTVLTSHAGHGDRPQASGVT